MRAVPCTTGHCARRFAVAAVLIAAVILGIGPPAMAAPTSPFLFSYTFNGHLKIGGGNFTVDGKVYLAVTLDNGTVKFRRTVIARPHAVTPGGAIYVETTIAAPCAVDNNGYARAYDYTTKTWSPKLLVGICQRFD